jgi:DNA-binding NarL/FixJ family response regulator
MPRNLSSPLTDAELDALQLAASGYTSRQIAHRLDTTEVGVHLRLKAAATKLGARSRTHAVAVALVTGLLDPADIELPATRKAAA